MSKVWFISGVDSSIGAGAANVAVKAGDRVVTTGRNVQKVRVALREVASDGLHVLPLDVSDEAQSRWPSVIRQTQARRRNVAPPSGIPLETS